MKNKLASTIFKYIWIAFTIGLLIFVNQIFVAKSAAPLFDVQRLSPDMIEKMENTLTYQEALLSEKGATLQCNGYNIPLDVESNTYYLAQPMEADDFQGIINISKSSLQVCFVEDSYLNNKADSIAQSHSFKLIIYDDTSYQTANMIMTGTPILDISHDREQEQNYSEEDVDNYYYNSEIRYYGDITIWGAGRFGKEFDILKSQVRYHERGATSAIYAKKNYTIKLLEKDGTGDSQPLFDMPESADWKLINLFTDKSKVRDMTSLKLWKEIAEQETDFDEAGADMEYCEVILDGKYMGLYGIVYPINEKTLNLDDNDILYKILAGEPPSEGALGYSIANNYNVAYPIRMRYPKTWDDIGACWKPMVDYISAAYVTQNQAATVQHLNLENISDFYLFIQAVAASDNQFKNTYMVAKVDQDDYTFYTIPWDLNYSFGDCYTYDSSVYYTQFNSDTDVIYCDRTLYNIFDANVAGAGDVMRSRYETYRQSVLSPEHIYGLMEENMNYLLASGAFRRESETYPEIGNSSDLSDLKLYIFERMSKLDDKFLK